jgi:NAD(P)-dependent dehydrogenase (short-subunit alcohol dehydrogenase family)
VPQPDPGPAGIAVVTGANRGIGKEVARQLALDGYTVILGSRDPAKGEAAARDLGTPDVRSAGGGLRPHQLDVADPESVGSLAAGLEKAYGRVDVLVNNAAVHYDTWQRAIGADLAVVEEALQINLVGAWRMCVALGPLLRRSRRGRLVNVSSGAGSFGEGGASAPAYSVSKAALDRLTQILAADLRRDGVLVNAVCPGWVATDMGGPGGRPVEAGAASVLWAVRLPDDGPTGGFFRDGRRIPW